MGVLFGDLSSRYQTTLCRDYYCRPVALVFHHFSDHALYDYEPWLWNLHVLWRFDDPDGDLGVFLCA